LLARQAAKRALFISCIKGAKRRLQEGLFPDLFALKNIRVNYLLSMLLEECSQPEGKTGVTGKINEAYKD
jgi:hypothetical protein